MSLGPTRYRGGTDLMGAQLERLRAETHPLPRGGTDLMGAQLE
jgi:hypothetical protein